MRVKALEKTYYNRRDVMPGEEYEMDDREEMQAKLLATLGKIEIIKAERPKQTLVQKIVEPEKPPAPPEPMTTQTAEPISSGPRRYYRRRDMKAEGT